VLGVKVQLVPWEEGSVCTIYIKRGLGPGGGAIEIGLLKRECGDFK